MEEKESGGHVRKKQESLHIPNSPSLGPKAAASQPSPLNLSPPKQRKSGKSKSGMRQTQFNPQGASSRTSVSSPKTGIVRMQSENEQLEVDKEIEHPHEGIMQADDDNNEACEGECYVAGHHQSVLGGASLQDTLGYKLEPDAVKTAHSLIDRIFSRIVNVQVSITYAVISAALWLYENLISPLVSVIAREMGWVFRQEQRAQKTFMDYVLGAIYQGFFLVTSIFIEILRTTCIGVKSVVALGLLGYQHAKKRVQELVARRTHKMSLFRAARALRAGAGKEFKFPVALENPSAYKRNPFSEFIYKTFLQKTSAYIFTMGVLAFVFDYSLDGVVDHYYAKINKGRTFNDVISTFPAIPPNCGDDDDDEDEE